jgi:hypothetical protein
MNLMVGLTGFENDRPDQLFCGACGWGEGGDLFFWSSGLADHDEGPERAVFLEIAGSTKASCDIFSGR